MLRVSTIIIAPTQVYYDIMTVACMTSLGMKSLLLYLPSTLRIWLVAVTRSS